MHSHWLLWRELGEKRALEVVGITRISKNKVVGILFFFFFNNYFVQKNYLLHKAHSLHLLEVYFVLCFCLVLSYCYYLDCLLTHSSSSSSSFPLMLCYAFLINVFLQKSFFVVHANAIITTFIGHDFYRLDNSLSNSITFKCESEEGGCRTNEA